MSNEKKENQKHSKQIQKLIKTYKKQINKTIQRSELIKRNNLFNEELTGFINRVGETFFEVHPLKNEIFKQSEDNILLKLNYPQEDFSDKSFSDPNVEIKEDRYWKSFANLDAPISNPANTLRKRIHNKINIFQSYKRQWNIFCKRWHIEDTWNSDIDTLTNYARENIEIYKDWDPLLQKASLLISINEWTTLDDIKNKWAKIENYQYIYLGKKEQRPNFARDLIWYDLSTDYNMTPSEIANLWNKYYPEDIDILVTRRFRKDIPKNALNGKVLDDIDLLKEIHSGTLKETYEKSFEEERKFYITGKIKKGSKYITTAKPFLDVIKKAIHRMQIHIEASEMPPLPERNSFTCLPPQRIS